MIQNTIELSSSLQAAKFYLFHNLPLVYSLVQNCKVIFTDHPRCQTACINAKGVIYINNSFWLKLDLLERAFLLTHEVFHPTFDYFMRAAELNSTTANRAHDFVINLMISEMIEGGFIDGGCLDEKYRGMAFEQVYVILMKENDMEQESQGDSQGAVIDGAGDGESEGNGTLDNSELQNDGLMEDEVAVDEGLETAREVEEEQTSEKLEESSHEWRERLSRALEFHQMQSQAAGRGQGSLPANLIRMIEDRIVSKVPWEKHLHLAIGELCGRMQPNYNRQHRRLGAIGSTWMMPAESYQQIDVAVYVDTSGSISEGQLSRGIAEIRELLHSSGGTIRFLEGDAAIQEDLYLNEIPENVRGGGGTSFVPVFDHLERFPDQTKAIVIFTDTWGGMPDYEPEIPVYWAVYSECMSEGIEVPFGEVIEIPADPKAV